MNLMQNARRIGLVGLVLVGSSVSAFADTILQWSTQTATGTTAVSPFTTATTSATSSFTGGAGTEISASGVLLRGATDVNGNPITAYLTFDLKSTDAATTTTVGSNTNISQDYEGTFSITSAASGGTVLVATTDIGGAVVARAGATSFNLNTYNNTIADFTGSLITGPNPAYVAPFGLDLNLYRVTNLTTTTVNGVKTVSFSPSNIGTGRVDATPGTPSAVPEPSTFALLGLGVAGLAVGAYRRRKAAAAV